MMTHLPQVRMIALAVLVLSATATIASGQGQALPRGVWWRSEEFTKELGLTSEQIASLDTIFKDTRPDLQQEFDELERLETKLSTLIERNADEALIAREIDRVETARASVNKTRSLMYVRMRKVLTPEQREQMQLLERRRNGGQQRRNDGPRRPESDLRNGPPS
jgi:Spy/CpxP family protein refolding chaperone